MATFRGGGAGRRWTAPARRSAVRPLCLEPGRGRLCGERGMSAPIGVIGLWHLGSVTAACLAEAGHEVIAVDPDSAVVADLAAGRPPVSEPGLAELLARNATRLHFTTEPRDLDGRQAGVGDFRHAGRRRGQRRRRMGPGPRAGAARAAARRRARDRLLPAAGRQCRRAAGALPRRPWRSGACASRACPRTCAWAPPWSPSERPTGSWPVCAARRIGASWASCWRRSAARCNGCGWSRPR